MIFVVLFVGAPLAGAIVAEHYSQNSLCRQNACSNPLFPGLNDLPRLEEVGWQCASQDHIRDYLGFCKDAVDYDAALPSPNISSEPMDLLVRAQDDAAATMFFFHMSGIGYDAWDDAAPSQSVDDCVRAAWKMVCFTYFPRAEAGCRPGERSSFKRPCMSSCSNYLQACNVECCDESPQCVFSHTVQSQYGETYVQTGYVDAVGPSPLCTGAARRGAATAPLIILLCIFCFHMASGSVAPLETGRSRRFAIATVLAATVPIARGFNPLEEHNVGNWRQNPDYLNEFKFVMNGQSGPTATLNSCSAGVSPTQQCSGHGYCKTLSSSENSVAFCQCTRDWADPECRTRRKSQTTAFFLSLFFGFLGADVYYLGYPVLAFAKAATGGGLGMWWLTDIVRVGSGAVYTSNYRVAADLPHWAFMLVTLSVFIIVSFFYAIYSYMAYRIRKRAAFMETRDEEESSHYQNTRDAYLGQGPPGEKEQFPGLKFRAARADGERGPFEEPRHFSGYGATLPSQVPSADAAYGVMAPSKGEMGPYSTEPGTKAPHDIPLKLPPVRLPPIVASDGPDAQGGMQVVPPILSSGAPDAPDAPGAPVAQSVADRPPPM